MKASELKAEIQKMIDEFGDHEICQEVKVSAPDEPRKYEDRPIVGVLFGDAGANGSTIPQLKIY